MKLTGRERMMRILRGEPADRVAVKVWGLAPGQPPAHSAYLPIYRLAMATADLVGETSSQFDFVAGSNAGLYSAHRRPKSEEWTEVETVLHTPGGDLSSIEMVSNTGRPGYTITHFVKEPEDFGKILSVPYEPSPISLGHYAEVRRAVGDRGIVMFDVDHAGYALQRLTGSELLACFSLEERGLLLETLDVFKARIRAHVKGALEALRGAYGADCDMVFGWAGPELLIPPLLSPGDFEEFCFDADRPVMDMIHGAGGRVWIHCHGRVGRFVSRFADMGCDLLNPVEPPPMGDITLEEAFQKAGGRMALEGNIEIHEIMEAPESRVRELVEDAVKTGARHGRFVLCPSAGYMEMTDPTDTVIRNLAVYIKYGMECAEACRW